MTVQRETKMQEVIVKMMEVRALTGRHADGLARRHSVPAIDLPVGALGMMFNYVTLALEVADHYRAIWEKPAPIALPPERVARLRAENGDRVVMVGKTAFVWCMSAAEQAARDAAQRHPTLFNPRNTRKRQYLADIVRTSGDIGLIDTQRRPLWFGANDIRNRLVHNNGIGEDAKSWQFSSELTITMERDKMMRGDLMTFPRLVEWLVDAYAAWCDALLIKVKGIP